MPSGRLPFSTQSRWRPTTVHTPGVRYSIVCAEYRKSPEWTGPATRAPPPTAASARRSRDHANTGSRPPYLADEGADCSSGYFRWRPPPPEPLLLPALALLLPVSLLLRSDGSASSLLTPLHPPATRSSFEMWGSSDSRNRTSNLPNVTVWKRCGAAWRAGDDRQLTIDAVVEHGI
jgi:hypothetical protein